MTPERGGKTPLQRLALLGAPALFVLVLLLGPPEGLGFDGLVVLGLLLLMALWWMSEAIPIPVTSLLPLVVVPTFGVRSMAEASAPYADRIVILLLGGFIIAKSVERWNLHERLALLTVRRGGTRTSGLLLGFLVASAGLSAWISNTATAIMLMPVALSVAYSLGAEPKARSPLAVALCLAVAYGASIGGLATPVGTPTNLIVIGALEQAGAGGIGFARWMAFGVPAVLLLLPAAWGVLMLTARRAPTAPGGPQEIVSSRLAALGPWTTPEKRTLMVFGAVAFFWVFRTTIQDVAIAGMQPFAGLTDHVIAVAGAVAMFLVPAGCRGERRGEMLLDWETAERIPWGVVLLFGGGLSLAAAITATGLGAYMASLMGGVMGLPSIAVMAVFALIVVFWTEITSNVATAAALMPVVIAVAAGAGIEPASLAVPVALAASCAFMFPMATAPNAIAFAAGEVTIVRMARIGFGLNLVGVLVITLVARLLAPS